MTVNNVNPLISIGESAQQSINDVVSSMHNYSKSPEIKRKEMELELVELIQGFQNSGLNINYISIDFSNGVDARVTLNETANVQEQVANPTGTRKNPEEL
ncbi:hypothetical protein [Acinetobacter nosocomialis]|uniref:hypothetical protein n=1 Tax=Acinetobacter nosocomialis TaxID=106654 RepID=UPI0024DEBE8F|nr:hypothetical protein [Acinetobacter nosocomialis]